MNWKELKIVLKDPKRTHDDQASLFPACLMVFPSSKLAQFEQDLKHLHHELRSKEIFLTKVNIFSLQEDS